MALRHETLLSISELALVENVPAKSFKIICILQKTFRSFKKKFFFLNFRFDALSHRSSGNSINVSENMGVVSNTSTPLNGSFENMGVANLSSVTDNVKKIHSGRGRGLAGGSQSPLGLYSVYTLQK